MKRNYYRFFLTNCFDWSLSFEPTGFCRLYTSSSSSSQSQYYNAGNANLSVTGAQFDQYIYSVLILPLGAYDGTSRAQQTLWIIYRLRMSEK